MNELEPGFFESKMRSFIDNFGYGCNNEILRMFSGFQDEEVLNNIDPTSPFSQALVALAKKNISKCIPLILEDAEGNRKITKHWLPLFSLESELHLAHAKYNAAEPISQQYVDVIQRMNVLDIELYQFGLQRHRQLLASLE